MPIWAPSFPSSPVDVRRYGTLTSAAFGAATSTGTAAANVATIRSAVEAVYAAGGGTVFIPRAAGTRTYQIQRQVEGGQTPGSVSLLAGVNLVSDGAALDQRGNCSHITAAATLGTSTSITADTTTTTTNLTVTSSTGFSAGQEVFIRIGQAAYDAAEPDYWLFAKVASIPDSTHITIDRPVNYALSVAGTPTTNQRKIQVITEAPRDLLIEGLYLYSPDYPTGNTEGGVTVTYGRNVTFRQIRAWNPGAGLCAQFCDGVTYDTPAVDYSQAQNAQASKGRSFNFAECRNVFVNNTVLADNEKDFIVSEGACENVRFENCVIRNGFPGRDNTHVLLGILGKSQLSFGRLYLEGTAVSSFANVVGDVNSDYSIDDLSIRMTAKPGVDLAKVQRRLTLDGVLYPLRTWTKRVALTASTANAATTLPSGFAKSLEIYASTTTGITKVALKSAIETGSVHASLVAAGSMFHPTAGLLSQDHNAGVAKSLVVSTDGTLPANSYLTLEYSYFADQSSVTQTTYGTTGLLQ